jgi:hypothetical protein
MSAERNDPGNEVGADNAPPQDPWFEPARPTDGEAWANGYAADGARAADWFLRTGRAGLRPESMTTSAQDDDAALDWRHEAAGAPPWASEKIHTDGRPPPWESGPWSGPGEERSARRSTDGAYAVGARVASPAGAGNWQARAALVTGILPLVVPGIVLGALGLRQARSTGAGRGASLLGIALSVVWAVVLGVLIFGSTGSSAGCSVPSAVRSSYGQVVRDLSSGAPRSVLSGELSATASKANAAAANAQQVPLRSALLALASDLEVAQADLAGKSHDVSSSLLLRLRSDGTVLTNSCAS